MNSIDRFINFVQQRTQLPESKIRAGVRHTERLESREAEDTFVQLFQDSNAVVQLDRAMGMAALVDPNCERARNHVHSAHTSEVRGQAFPMLTEIENELVTREDIHVRSHPSIVQAGPEPGQALQIIFSDPGRFPQVHVGDVFVDSTPGEKGELWFFAPAQQ